MKNLYCFLKNGSHASYPWRTEYELKNASTPQIINFDDTATARGKQGVLSEIYGNDSVLSIKRVT
jgi:hypothetical protein